MKLQHTILPNSRPYFTDKVHNPTKLAVAKKNSIIKVQKKQLVLLNNCSLSTALILYLNPESLVKNDIDEISN